MEWGVESSEKPEDPEGVNRGVSERCGNMCSQQMPPCACLVLRRLNLLVVRTVFTPTHIAALQLAFRIFDGFCPETFLKNH